VILNIGNLASKRLGGIYDMEAFGEGLTSIFYRINFKIMGKKYAVIDAKMEEWIGAQKLFFVSTAPLSEDGLINCSPKGMDSFRVIDERTIAYLDLTGSGVETIAHLKENGRIVIMMCAFDGPPKIFRFYGVGEALEKGSEGFNEMKHLFPEYLGARSIIRVSVETIRDACGYAVPHYEYKEERDVLDKWTKNKGAEGIAAYQVEQNTQSLDGLPGLVSE